MTRELRSTLETSRTREPAMTTYLACMAHIIQLALGVFMSNLGVKGNTMSWEAHEHNQQFGENESTNIGKSQKLQKEGNARIIKVWAMRPGLANIIEKVRISTHFERPETNLHIAENACCDDDADTWSSTRVDSLSKSQIHNGRTTHNGCENTVEVDTRVAWKSLPIMRIHPWVAEESKIHRLPATFHNTGRMGDCQVRHGSFEAIPILDPVDVKKAYSYSASCHHCLQWHVRSYGWHYASVG